MNILYIASSSDFHIDLWVKHFTKDNDVFLFSDKEDYLRDQAYDDVKIFLSEGYLGKVLNYIRSDRHMLFQLNKLISTKYFAAEVEEIIESYDIDIVHAHSLYYGYLASYIKSNVPIVFTPMGSDVIIHAQKNKIYNMMAKRAFKFADVITGDSLVKQKSGFKLGAPKKRNYIVQNGVDSKVFYPKKNDLKGLYNVANDEILIFSPRAITPLYNIDVIIKSLSELIRKGYKLKCMFSFAFGDKYEGQLKDLIKRLKIEKNIIWLGYLTYEAMADHYNASDIVVSIPSSDSSPKSVYEAMFCAKPIVVSDLEWSYEYAEHSECMLRVTVGDSDELSRALERIINDEGLAEDLSSNALSCAHKYFDYENNMKEMEKIMLDAI